MEIDPPEEKKAPTESGSSDPEQSMDVAKTQDEAPQNQPSVVKDTPIPIVTSSPVRTAVPIAELEKERIQQHFVLLMHADECRKKEKLPNREVRQCSSRHCQTMKNVLNHLTSCQAIRSCTVPHCASSRQIIAHWKKCRKNGCTVCSLLKQAFNRRQQLVVRPKQVASFLHACAIPQGPPLKEWHHTITQELRNQLVVKIVRAIFPTNNPSALRDRRMVNVVAYARMVERDMYRMANSKEEYYLLLAIRICKVQKQLGERMRQRKEERMQRNQQVGPDIGPNASK